MTQTMEQLKNRSWTSFRKAADALKAAGFPVKGEDYEIREAIKGSFQIMPIEADGAAAKAPAVARGPFTISIVLSKTQTIEETADTIVDAIRKRSAMNVAHGKMGLRPKIFAPTADGTSVVQLGPWTSLAKAEAAMKDAGLPMSGPDYDIGERVKGAFSLGFPTTEENTDVKTKKTAPARAKAGATKAAGKTATKKAQAKKGAATKARVAATAPATPPADPPKAAEPKDETPTNDMSALTPDGGPYILRIAHWPQHDITGGALKASLAMGEPVMIVDKHGKVIRTIDGRLAKPMRKAKAAKASGQRKTAGMPRAGSKTAEAVRLLLRPNGAKQDELTKAAGFSFGKFFVERAARSIGATLQALGDKHWKFTAQAQA